MTPASANAHYMDIGSIQYKATVRLSFGSGAQLHCRGRLIDSMSLWR